MNEYIISQSFVNENMLGNVNQFSVGCIIRRVVANNVDEAIGKFIRNTQDVSATKKLNVECLLLSELKLIE